jgi:peptidoglycan hydrolase-like protein with peptidoglycan-binding domain
MLERGGELGAKPIKSLKEAKLEIVRHVEPRAKVMTDEWPGFRPLTIRTKPFLSMAWKRHHQRLARHGYARIRWSPARRFHPTSLSGVSRRFLRPVTMRFILFASAALSLLGSGFIASPVLAQTASDYGNRTVAGTYCPHIAQTVVRGSNNNDVLELQKFFSDYYDVSPSVIRTGYFGRITQGYAIQFQKEQGLPSFGIVGSLTRAPIARVCGNSSATTVTVIAHQPPQGNASVSVSTQQSSITQASNLNISWQSQNAPTDSQIALWRVNVATGDSVLVQYGQSSSGQYAAYVHQDGEPLPACPVTVGGIGQWPTGCWQSGNWPAGSYKITAKLYTPNGNVMPTSYLATSDSGTFTVIANPYQAQQKMYVSPQ